MSQFVPMRHKHSGVVADYPLDFLDHPVFGPDLELYFPDEYEEDKVSNDAPLSVNREKKTATTKDSNPKDSE